MSALAEVLLPVERLTNDLKTASRTLGVTEARYLVDAYYAIQQWRITAGNQTRALTENEEPNAVVRWLFDQAERLENEVKKALAQWCEGQAICRWSLSIHGIGPVISAGLAAHIDIRKAPTVGHVWRFAGLDPTDKWNRHEKRPWNAALKVLCWKASESFVKVQNSQKDIYGKVYAKRKRLEEERNARGDFRAQAEESLASKRWSKGTEAFKAYEAGRLPQARIHLRAERYAVKLFLAHWHHVAYELEFGVAPPKPYVISQLGHAHYLAPPNWPMETV